MKPWQIAVLFVAGVSFYSLVTMFDDWGGDEERPPPDDDEKKKAESNLEKWEAEKKSTGLPPNLLVQKSAMYFDVGSKQANFIDPKTFSRVQVALGDYVWVGVISWRWDGIKPVLRELERIARNNPTTIFVLSNPPAYNADPRKAEPEVIGQVRGWDGTRNKRETPDYDFMTGDINGMRVQIEKVIREIR